MAHQAGRMRPVHARRSEGQALVELALVMPLLVGIIAVVFQFGILFISYLSLVHGTRDLARWAAVHPDTIDGSSCATSNSLWAHVCTDLPTVIDPSKVTLIVTPTCTGLVSGHCSGRNTGAQLGLTLRYDASSNFFLPPSFNFGPFLQVAIPTLLPDYNYFVMVEPH